MRAFLVKVVNVMKIRKILISYVMLYSINYGIYRIAGNFRGY